MKNWSRGGGMMTCWRKDQFPESQPYHVPQTHCWESKDRVRSGKKSPSETPGGTRHKWKSKLAIRKPRRCLESNPFQSFMPNQSHQITWRIWVFWVHFKHYFPIKSLWEGPRPTGYTDADCVQRARNIRQKSREREREWGLPEGRRERAWVGPPGPGGEGSEST